MHSAPRGHPYYSASKKSCASQHTADDAKPHSLLLQSHHSAVSPSTRHLAALLHAEGNLHHTDFLRKASSTFSNSVSAAARISEDSMGGIYKQASSRSTEHSIGNSLDLPSSVRRASETSLCPSVSTYMSAAYDNPDAPPLLAALNRNSAPEGQQASGHSATDHGNGSVSVTASPFGAGGVIGNSMPFSGQPPILPLQSLRGSRNPSILCISSSLHRHTGMFPTSAHSSESQTNSQHSSPLQHNHTANTLEPSAQQLSRGSTDAFSPSGLESGCSSGSGSSASASRRPPLGPRRVASSNSVPRSVTRLSGRPPSMDSTLGVMSQQEMELSPDSVDVVFERTSLNPLQRQLQTSVVPRHLRHTQSDITPRQPPPRLSASQAAPLAMQPDGMHIHR